MTHVPLVDLKAQYALIKAEVDEAIQRVLTSANFILGEEVLEFERAFARYVGVPEAVGLASGTSALQLALLSCGVGTGDEVITAAHTFIATAEAISWTGAKPVFADIDPQTYTLDPDQLARVLTSRTRAIIPVHIYGQAADMGPIMEFARKHSLWVIEDAAQAHGARYEAQACGALGHLACFSFYPGKNLGAYGDAGAVTGSDLALLARVRKLRDHGRQSKYVHDEIGFGERLDALQAAVLSTKLRHLDDWTTTRRLHAQYYNHKLSALDVTLPCERAGSRHVYHLYVLRTPRRDALLTHLHACGIGAGIHYPVPLHRQPAYLKLGYGQVELPETERAAGEVISLPLYPEMNAAQLDRVADAVREFLLCG